MIQSNFPKNVRLLSTMRYFDEEGKAFPTRSGYANFNLATHVGDDPQVVKRNRDLLIQRFNLPSEPKYLEQTHSNICLQVSSGECVGDAVVTKDKGIVCAVLTADCLPIFACDRSGTQVGVAQQVGKGL